MYLDHRALHSFPTRRSSDLCTATPRRRAAMPRTSRVLVLLHAAERTVLGGVDGGGAAPLEGVEQGRGQELVPQPEQVLERRPALLGRHDFREPPPPRLELQQ